LFMMVLMLTNKKVQ